jgi:hypothetical protein
MSTTLAVAALAAAMRLVASHEYAGGAPPGFSGGFKEDSCHACHFDTEPNVSSGGVTVEGVPATFTPGDTYELTITLRQAGIKLGGFQLTARFENDGAQAGTIAAGRADAERVGIESQAGIQYAGQKRPGAEAVAPDAARWTVAWTAPKSGGAVLFNVSANAANGNDSADGDFVYTASARSRIR